jgi:hypothetical protein
MPLKNRIRRYFRRKNFFTMETKILANTATGTHEDCITKCAKTAIGRNRLVVLDTADPESVNLSGADSVPFGVTTDEAAAGEIVNIDLLGCSNTIHITTGAAVEAGELLIVGADGKVLPLPTGEGVYTCVGIALSTAAGGGVVEVLTSLPSQYIIEAAE